MYSSASKKHLFHFFGFQTLLKSYLLRVRKVVVERPQHLFMRVALAIHGSDMLMVRNVYNSISNKYYTHATPTLFNAGTNYQQMSSCFLLGTEDSVEGLYKTAADMAQISMKNDHDIATDSKQERSSPSKFVSMKFNATVKFGGTHMLSYTPHTP